MQFKFTQSTQSSTVALLLCCIIGAHAGGISIAMADKLIAQGQRENNESLVNQGMAQRREAQKLINDSVKWAWCPPAAAGMLIAGEVNCEDSQADSEDVNCKALGEKVCDDNNLDCWKAVVNLCELTAEEIEYYTANAMPIEKVARHSHVRVYGPNEPNRIRFVRNRQEYAPIVNYVHPSGKGSIAHMTPINPPKLLTEKATVENNIIQ